MSLAGGAGWSSRRRAEGSDGGGGAEATGQSGRRANAAHRGLRRFCVAGCSTHGLTMGADGEGRAMARAASGGGGGGRACARAVGVGVSVCRERRCGVAGCSMDCLTTGVGGDGGGGGGEERDVGSLHNRPPISTHRTSPSLDSLATADASIPPDERKSTRTTFRRMRTCWPAMVREAAEGSADKPRDEGAREVVVVEAADGGAGARANPGRPSRGGGGSTTTAPAVCRVGVRAMDTKQKVVS
jgi:hypothetical protein